MTDHHVNPVYPCSFSCFVEDAKVEMDWRWLRQLAQE
jgi:hypothetical protein